MKGVVAFDSVYGNTAKVADAIAEEIRAQGHEVEVIDLGRRIPRGVSGDFAFIGSPTRMSRMTGRVKKFVRRLDKGEWSSKPIIPFETVMTVPEDPVQKEKAAKWTTFTAAPRSKEMAEKRGLRVNDDTLRVFVTGLKGPLTADALEKAKEFTREFLAKSK
jgi:flavodoxin